MLIKLGKNQFQKIFPGTVFKIKKRNLWRWRVLVWYYTVCKENKCHPINSRRGRLKGPIYSILIVFSQKGVSFCLLFTAYIVRDNEKTFTS